MRNLHFLSNKPNKPIFHKNLDVLFSMFPYTHASNTLLVDNTPYIKTCLTTRIMPFLESFTNVCEED
jgi:hypothetical protein